MRRNGVSSYPIPGEQHQLITRWTMTEALVPPKPNELDSAVLISRLRAA
jgi:hypothetical protein